MSRRFLLRAAACTAGFYVLLLILRGFTFLISHLPPAIIPLDWAVIGLTYLEQAMLLPRWLLRQLWFSETTPAILNWALGFLNSVVWGLGCAAFRTWRDRERAGAPKPPVIGRG
jgi:hypothetical protein